MGFTTEATGYEKTILSDLQGAWSLLRQLVVDDAGFEGWDRVIFHIDLDAPIQWSCNKIPPELLGMAAMP